MVEITNASNLMPTSITVVEDGTTIEITTTPLDVTVATGTLAIQTGGITSVNGDLGPVVVLDTDDISEGVTNQYYTDARVDTYLQSGGVSSINFGNNTSLRWNADDGTLEFPVNNEVTLQVGQENLIHVKNLSGATLTNGTVVAVTGASGSKLTVDLADYTDENLSSATIAVMTQDLGNNAVGYATTSGLVRGLNTSSYTEGDILWLDGNGTFVATKPLTPLHLVQIGWVVRSHATEGSIFVYVKNGWELEELHDVLITTPADGDFIKWNGTNSYWENIAPTTDDITEGTNLYYTDARVQTKLGDVGGHILPNANVTYDLGSNTLRWRDLYLSGSSIKLGNATLTETGGVLNVTGGFDLSNNDTGDLAEGTNLYYTTARANTDFDSRLATKTTTNLAEGTNLYYTDARVNTLLGTKGYATETYVDTGIANLVDSAPATLDTLNELAAALGDDPNFATTVTNSLAAKLENINNESIGDLSDVDITTVAPTNGQTLVWNSVASEFEPGTIQGYTSTDFDTDFATKTTTDLTEGTNLYYTDGRADARVNLQTGVNLDLSSKTTSDLAEGTNLYYTDARAQAVSINAVSEDPAPLLNGSLNANANDIVNVNNIDVNSLDSVGNAGGQYNSTFTNASTTGSGISVTTGTTGSTTTAGNLINARIATPGGYSSRFNVDYTGKMTINGVYSFPTADGTAGQVLTTDGLGNVTFAAPSGGINNVVEDTSPQLGGDLDVNNFAILNNGSNPYFVLGNDNTLFSPTHALGAYRSSSISGFTGATRAYFNGDTSKATLGATITGSNGRIVNNYQAATLDLNSNSLTSTGINRGLNTIVAGQEIANTGGTASTLAQARHLLVQGAFMSGSNVSIDEMTGVYINQFYESDDSTGAITNAYGVYIRDGGTAGVNLTNKYSIYSDGANNPMYHAGTITVGAITLPNTDGTPGQVLTTDGLGNLSFSTPASTYGDADVDTHLNTSTAAIGEVLSWNGTDYNWIAQGGGGGSFTGDLAGNVLTDSTGTLQITKNPSGSVYDRGGVIANSKFSRDFALNDGFVVVNSENNTVRLTTDLLTGFDATTLKSTETTIDTAGYDWDAGEYPIGVQYKVTHGNSNFAGNGQGVIGRLEGMRLDVADNANGTNDNQIKNVTGMIVRVRDDFDTSNLNSAIGLEIATDAGLNNAATSFRSILSQNTDARLEHWGQARFGSHGGVRLAPGNDSQIQVKNQLNQFAPLVLKNVDNNTNFNATDKTVIDESVTDNQFFPDEIEREYYSTLGTFARATTKFQAPQVAANNTPQIGFGQTLNRPVYNSNRGNTANHNEVIYDFNSFGTSGFWLSNGTIDVPARQNIAYGFNVDFQKGFQNPYAANDGAQSVFNLTTSARHMTSRIVYSYNTGAVSNFVAIPDSVWYNTGMGVFDADYDKFWSFGTAWEIEMIANIPQWAANATVTINNALPPSGIIPSNPGNTSQIYPAFANTPAWANTSTKAITMTRPTSGTEFYRWVVEWLDGRLYIKTWETWNIL